MSSTCHHLCLWIRFELQCLSFVRGQEISPSNKSSAHTHWSYPLNSASSELNFLCASKVKLSVCVCVRVCVGLHPENLAWQEHAYLSASSRIRISTSSRLKLGAFCRWSISRPSVAMTTSGPSLRAASCALRSMPPVKHMDIIRIRIWIYGYTCQAYGYHMDKHTNIWIYLSSILISILTD